MPLLDLKDLQALLVFVGENAGPIGLRYGNVAPATVGAIQRRLLVLENQGGTQLFGEPALDLGDLMSVDASGAGRINILASDRLMASPRLYATFLLWMLSELFERLPEVGDPDKPKLVFFFDEAHLLFQRRPKGPCRQGGAGARLIRSKGVGQSISSRRAPRIFPKDPGPAWQPRAARAARLYREGPEESSAARGPDLSRQSAVLDRRGDPRGRHGEAVTRSSGQGRAGHGGTHADPPPSSLAGPIDPGQRTQLIAASPFAGSTDVAIDRESAFEMLKARADAAAEAAAAQTAEAEAARNREAELNEAFNNARRWDGGTAAKPPAKPAARRGDSVAEAFAMSFARQLGTKSGQALVRGVLGSLFPREMTTAASARIPIGPACICA